MQPIRNKNDFWGNCSRSQLTVKSFIFSLLIFLRCLSKLQLILFDRELATATSLYTAAKKCTRRIQNEIYYLSLPLAFNSIKFQLKNFDNRMKSRMINELIISINTIQCVSHQQLITHLWHTALHTLT